MVAKSKAGRIINDFFNKYLLYGKNRKLECELDYEPLTCYKEFNPNIGNFILDFYFKRAADYRKAFTSKRRLFSSPKRLEKKIFTYTMRDTKNILKYIIDINNQYESASGLKKEIRQYLNDLLKEKPEYAFSTQEEIGRPTYFSIGLHKTLKNSDEKSNT